MDVRTALPSDMEEIMDMCRSLHEENGLFPMNEERVRSVIDMALQRKGGILGVIGNAGKIEGMIYIMICQHWSSEEWHLEELFAYVKPEFRGMGPANKLLKFAKKCAKELNMALIIGIVSNTRTESKVSLYKKQFGSPRGNFFVYNSRWDTSDGFSMNGHG